MLRFKFDIEEIQKGFIVSSNWDHLKKYAPTIQEVKEIFDNDVELYKKNCNQQKEQKQLDKGG